MKGKVSGLKVSLEKDLEKLTELYGEGPVNGFSEQLPDCLFNVFSDSVCFSFQLCTIAIGSISYH